MSARVPIQKYAYIYKSRRYLKNIHSFSMQNIDYFGLKGIVCHVVIIFESVRHFTTVSFSIRIKWKMFRSFEFKLMLYIPQRDEN